jgi:hypothetical protein
MISHREISCLIILALTSLLFSQSSFEVISIEGSAKVQHSQKRTWDNIGVGTKILDNDMVETFFQTKLIMRFGINNIVILGSNSKALMNIVQKDSAGQSKVNVNLTLFGGGIFAKAISDCHVSIYTANAVGVMDSGSVSTVAESKTGETGFQVLGGSIDVRNIAQQKSRELRSGLTTMILPNKEPTAPLYITFRHVAVLKHFFGDDYISSELDASGIKPTEEGGAANRFLLSQNLKASAAQADEGMHKTLFSINKIYGSIIDDESSHSAKFTPVKKSFDDENTGVLDFTSDFAIGAGTMKPGFYLVPSVHFSKFDAALRFSLVQNALSQMSAGFTSAGGWLDKIERISFTPSESTGVYLGELSDYTLGHGLVVNNFCNKGINDLYHPLGLNTKVKIIDNILINAFLSDLSQPVLGGLYFKFSPSLYEFGAGYYFDFNQYSTFENERNRFVSFSTTDSIFKASPSNLQIYEFDFGVNIVSSYDMDMNLYFEFAQKLFNGGDGFVLRMPTFQVDMEKTCFGGGLVFESGRLPISQFSPFYLSNRQRIIRNNDQTESIDTLLTQNTILSKKRQAAGISIFYKTNPWKGSAIDFSLQQNIKERNSFVVFRQDSTDTSRDASIPDFSFNLKFSADEKLLHFMKFADIYIRQTHGALYPSQGTYFNSWGFESGFDAVTMPFFLNMAFTAGGKFYYFDNGLQNNTIDSGDMIFEFYAGLRWGFL